MKPLLLALALTVGACQYPAPLAMASSSKAVCDGTSGNRVQAVYATTGTGSAPASSIRQYAARVDGVFNASAQETGGTRHVRWVTTSRCAVDVATVRLPAGSLDTFSKSTAALRAAGLTRPDRHYLVWADAYIICGQGEQFVDDSPTNNWSNGRSALIGRIDRGCWGSTPVIEAHELTHLLGGVQLSAPHSDGTGHCTDGSDRMCAYPAPVCPSSHDNLLDCNHDDYFSTAPPPGSYLATHWNVANSSFLSS